MKEGYFYGKGETKIFIRQDIPSKANAIVVIAHGYMEHSGRYLDFAEYLVVNNIGVCLVDHRGNGHSEGTEGDIEDFFDFIEDLKILILQLKSYHKPLITYGHSMGGLITFIYGLKYPQTISGQIFSSPALGVPIGCKNLPSFFYEGIGQVAGKMHIRRGGQLFSTRDKASLEVFREDTEVNDFSTVHFMDQFLRIGVGYGVVHAKNYSTPSLFLLGDKDMVIPISRNREILGEITYSNKKVIEYPGCMHDLLHDLEEEVTQIKKDILQWITEHLQNIKS